MTQPHDVTPDAVELTDGREAPSVVDRFLDAIQSAAMPLAVDLYTESAQLDAVVPGWRFHLVGSDAIRDEYGRWFADPAVVEELRRSSAGQREVLEYTLTWTENGVPHGARHVHVLDIDPVTDRIQSDHVWCGGRWPAALLAQMGAMAQ